MPHTPSVVLHTSWRGRLTAATSPMVLLGLGGYGVADRFRWFPFVILAVGVALLLVAVADYPIVTIVGAAGIERCCLLRRQQLGWDQITTLARPSQVSSWRRDHPVSGAGGAPPPIVVPGTRPAHLDSTTDGRPKGGLVAEVRRRPFLLCDKVESRAEFDAIVGSIGDWAPSVPVRASRPGPSVPPTWLHKKRRGSALDGLVDLLA